MKAHSPRKEDLLPARPTQWRPTSTQAIGGEWLEPISEPPVSTSTSRSPRAGKSGSTLSKRTTSSTCCRLGAGGRVLLFNGRDGEFSASLAANSRKSGLARRRRAHAGPGGPAGRRLSVRAAQARTARLCGAKGGRDGRAALAARHHAPHPGRPRESRAFALERDRGLRAVRRDLDAGNRAESSRLRDARALAVRAAAGVLRRGGRNRRAHSMRCGLPRAPTAASAS